MITKRIGTNVIVFFLLSTRGRKVSEGREYAIFEALSLMSRVARRLPGAAGLKRTPTARLSPGARVTPVRSGPRGKSPGSAPLVTTL